MRSFADADMKRCTLPGFLIRCHDIISDNWFDWILHHVWLITKVDF